MNKKRTFRLYTLCIVLILLFSPLSALFPWNQISQPAKGEGILDPISTITDTEPGNNFGWNVSGVGDVNGDGYDDIIAGAPYTDRISGEDWWNTDWSYRKKLTFDNSGQTEDLVNFPVLVNLSASNFDYLKAKLDGTDLRFIDTDNVTELNYEIEFWNSSGNSYIWVNVTRIDASSFTDYIWMYYGNSVASDGQNKSGTFDSSYVGVWHLNEIGGGTADEFKDSTSYDNDGQGGSGTPGYVPNRIDGKIGGGQEFDGIDDHINSGYSTSLDIGGTQITLEAWINFPGNDPLNYSGIMSHYGWDQGYRLVIENGADPLGFHLPEDTYTLVSAQDTPTDFWFHVVGVYDGSNMLIYLNGVKDSNELSKTDNITTTSKEFWIGHGDNTTGQSWSYPWDGSIDEVRVSNIARSADWIKAQHLSMNDTLITYGDEETRNWWNNEWSYRKKLTFDNSGQSEDLVNFPVLVNLSSLNFDYSKAKLDGTDLRFIDADGITELKYHIEVWNASEYSYVWVNVTNIAAGSSTDFIWMYYGNSGAFDVQDVSGTYDASYVGVWHLNESSGNALDSTSYGTGGTPSGGFTQGIKGKIDGAYDFNGIDGEVNMSDPIDGHLDFGDTDDFTIELWMYMDSTIQMVPFSKRNGASPSNVGYLIGITGLGVVNYEVSDGVDEFRVVGTTQLTTPAWHHIVCVWDQDSSTASTIYLDNVDDKSMTGGTIGNVDSLSNSVAFMLGNAPAASPFDGKLDEVRISNIARNMDWIIAQFLSMNNSFIIYGGEKTIGWWDTDWSYRKKLTFDNSGQSEDLVNFPVMVNLSSSNFDYSKAKSDGADLRFIDADNITELNYEIESWNSSGNSFIWVNVTNITAGSSSDHIWMYYGNSNASDGSNPESVWDSNYVGVWHLKENPDGTADEIKDSTSYSNDGTSVNSMDSNDQVDGKIDGSLEFDGINDYVNFGQITEIENIPKLTMSMWAKRGAVGDYVLVGYQEATAANSTAIELWNDGLVHLGLSDATYDAGKFPSNDVAWHHIVMVFDGTQSGDVNRLKGYLDGVPQSLTFEGTIPSQTSNPTINFFIGRIQWQFTSGFIDEVRISNIARSADWVKAQHLSMNNTFIAYGGEEAIKEDCGTAYIFFGYPGITLNNISAANANVTIYGSNAGDLFGWSLSDAGDVNNDGYDDVIIGAPGWGADRGRAYIFHGRAMSSWNSVYDADSDADVILTGENDGDRFGFSVSGAGDINSDGLSGDFYEGWSYRKKITIDSSKVLDDFTNFPVLINLTDSDLQSKARSDGYDIFFTDSDGKTKFDHEIERYNSSNGELVSWVRIPFLSSSKDTVIYIYYGNSGQTTSMENPTGVWDDNYVGVWHLAETSGNALDSTSYDLSGTLSGNINQGIAGIIGNAYQFDGTDGVVNMGDPADGHLDFGIDNFTVSVWVNVTQYADYQYFVFKGGNTDANNGYTIYYRETGQQACVSISDGTNPRAQDNFDTIENEPAYLVLVADRSTNELYAYLNGVLQPDINSISSLGDINNSYDLRFSRASGEVNGIMDEVRISSVARSAAWIQAEYNNTNDTSTFYTIGNEEINPVNWLYRKPITINASQVVEDLTDFPVLINITDSDLKNKARLDGYDILFTELDGVTKLDHEIERYKGSSGELIAWVKIPYLSSSSDTIIYMHYGNSGQISPTENPSGVWDANYTGVWHLNDDLLDSTSNDQDGINSGSTNASGMFANGQEFDDTNHVYVPDFSGTIVNSTLTLSGWVNASTPDGSHDGYFGFRNGVDADFYALRRSSGTEMEFRFTQSSGSSYTVVPFPQVISNEWHYISFVYDGNDVRAYINGVQEGGITSSSGYITNGSLDLFIGKDSNNNRLIGIIDEVRFSNTSRSAEWVATEFNNQNDTSTFYTVGNEEINPVNWLYRKPITINASKVTGDLADFPILINITDSNLKDKARSNGYDILFTTSNGETKLDHEIERYNSTTGELVAWVRIPSLSSTTDTVIYMYYGNLDSGDQSNPTGVWNNGYEAVWHLAEASGSGAYLNDSSENDHDGNPTNTNYNTSGKIDGARSLINGQDERITPNNQNELLDGWDYFALEFWIYPDYSSDAIWEASAEHHFVQKGGSINLGRIRRENWRAPNKGGFQMDVYYNTFGGTFGVVEIDRRQWNHIVYWYDGSNYRGYVNGQQEFSTSISTDRLASSSNQFYLGSSSVAPNATLDEVRISNVSRSVDWYITQYKNQNDTTTFYTLGNEEPLAGNNYDDIIIGAYGYGNDTGRAYVFFGEDLSTGFFSASSAQVIINGSAQGDRLGWDVSSANDVNDDDFGDMIIGAPGNNSNAGAAYILFGNNSMPSSMDASNADVTMVGENGGDELGFSLSVADDVNDDGYDDVIVGSPGINSDTGAAYIFFGNNSMNSLINATNANVIMLGESTGDKFGYSVNHAGDVNRDGVPDVVVGAPYYDDGATTDAGVVYVFEGGVSMDGIADWSYKGEQTNDHLGWSVSFAGNVNGDGSTYLIVGAPNNDDGGIDAGKVYILTMMSTILVITNIIATPSIQNIDGYVNITADVTALGGVDSVWVNITLPGGGYSNISMTQGVGDQWFYNDNYSIPGLYQYTIWANDTLGNWTKSSARQFQVINSPPLLSSANVTPLSGYTDTEFNFTVTYSDLDNHAPNNITVNITGIGVYDLIEVDPSDTNYSDGKEYYYNASGFSVGSYSFHFAANDTLGDWDETMEISGLQILNTPPVLLSPGVDPLSGTNSTNFNFTVNYMDLDNHPPGNITLNLTGPSGGVFDLIEVDIFDTNYSDGKGYYYNMTLSNGSYSYHFAANDSLGNWYETAEVNVPLVGVSKPIFSGSVVTPGSGYVDTWFNFTVNYSHPFDKGPDNITLNLTGPSGGIFDLIEMDPLDTNYTDGKLYYYNTSNLTVGSYSFYFAANDTDGNWSESGIQGFEVLNRDPVLALEQIDPITGFTDTGFNFTVTYTDLDNHAPDNITVNITGVGDIDLIEVDPLDTDYKDGKEYYYNASGFAVGSYSFHFAANDTIGNWDESGILGFGVLNRDPVLTLNQIDPLTGFTDTGFNFTVIYTDLDNHAPDNITVNITGVGDFNLIEVDPLDTNYTDGKAYYYNASGFPVGLYSFHFAANDTIGNWTESGILQFDVLNREPWLSLGQVDPTSGYMDTGFNFTVVYTDSENHSPDIISVNITGVGIYNLTELDPLDIDYTDGKIYYYNASGFAVGLYSFHFAANDTIGNWTESGVLQFEVFNRAPILSLEQVDPTIGYTDTFFNFTVTYTHLDNTSPDIITVNITGMGIYNLVEIDSLDTDFTDGKSYYYNLSGFAVGFYSFNFAANDTFGNWTESGVLQFEVFNRAPILSLEQVNPNIGDTDTAFNFTVTYTDLDDHAPDMITVNISGVGIYDLTEVDPLDNDYTDGKDYYYNASSFGVGSYSFHFAANDSLGDWVESGILGFDVLNRAPTLSSDGVDPTLGYTDTRFNFTVNYTDLDNQAPYNITLNLSGPLGGIFDLVEVDPSDTDYTDGKEYYLNMTLTSGFYSFHFEANDSLGLLAIETTEISAPDVIPKHGVLIAVDSVEDFSDDIYLTATLMDDFSNPISNENVAFYIDVNKNGIYEGGEYAGLGTTLADGSVLVNYTGDLPPGTYNFTAIYVGSGDYIIDDGKALLTIIAKQATLTAIGDIVDEGEVIYLTAILMDIDGNPIVDERVDFYIDKNKDGFYYPSEFIDFGITLTSGVAIVTYTVDIDPENYGIHAKYLGSANYSVNEIEGLLTVQNTGNKPPAILMIVPDQIKPEDSPPWPLDLTLYESDIEDTGPDLKWYLTGVDTTLYKVTGMNTSDDVLTFIPVPNAFGNDEVILWLWDSSGARVSQVLWINITPENDPPYFDPYPPNLFAHYDDPNTSDDDPVPWDYTFYVHDIESPLEDLIITTSQPTVDFGEGYAEVDGLKVTFHYPQSRVGESIPVFLTLFDGTDAVSAMIWVNVTSDWVPQLISKLPNVVLKENSTLYNVFDLDDYFVDRDEDSLYFSSGYFDIRVDINDNNSVDITALGHWTGTELVTFRARDPIGAIAEDTITVTVIPVNNPPEISGVPDLFVHYDYSYAFDLSPYIFDPDNITSELLVWTSESTDYIWLQPYNSLGIVVNYPEAMNGTTIPVTIFVSDGNSITSSQIQITVANNFPPELIYNLPDVFFDEDTILWNAFCLSDYFLDIDSDILFYTNGTKFINATINANLTVDFSAPENWYGFEIVTFRATDEKGALAEDKILVVVVPVNDAPTMESISKQEKEEGDQWVLDISQYIDDVDNNISELIITVQSEIGQGYVTLVGTVLMFQYPEGIREDVITIMVSDGELETTRSFIVSIESSPMVVPTLWDLIPWPWVFLLLIGTVSGAFAYYKKRSKYWVYEAFLIHEKGLPIAHASHEESLDLEDVVVSGMFTAVQNFINDIFSDQTSEDDWELDKMEFGDHKILLERSQDLYLAVIFEGHSPKLRNRMKKLLLKIDEVYGNVLNEWDGDMDQLDGIKAMTASLISKKRRKNHESESSPAQPQPEPQEEEFVDILNGREDTKRVGIKEFNEYLESVEEESPEIVGVEETEPEKVSKIPELLCPICGKEIEEKDAKCLRCGVEFAGIKDLLPSSSQKPENEGPKGISKEEGGHED